MNKDIDKIFRDKLYSLPKQPSGEVWERISAGLEDKKKKKAVLWYYAAASVVVLLLAGFLYQNNFKNDQETLAVKSGKILIKDAVPQVEIIDSVKVPASPVKNETPEKKTSTPKKEKAKKELSIPKVQDVELNVATIGTKNEIPALEEEAIVLIAAQPEPSAEELMLPEVSVTIKMAAIDQTLLADTKKPKTKAGKVIKQLMNFKNGKEVNLEELGIDTSVLAFAKRDK